jgi:glycosyltransferase involved in cell wall biosynthesis
MAESKNLTVGVLIPTFQRRAYLEQALKSVCDQTYNNIEILVIDNGSIDGTAEFMGSISDTRVRYVVNDQNIGMIGSINKGLKLFSDEVQWCTILSDDDLLDKQYIASMVEFVDAHSVKAIAHCNRIFINAEGTVIRKAHPAPLIESSLEYILNRARQTRETSLTGIFFLRKLFDDIGGYPKFSTGMATDDAFIFALSIKDKLYFNSDALVFARAHDQAESLKASDALKHIQALEEFADYVSMVARISKTYSLENMTALVESTRKYIKRLNGVIMLRSVYSLHGKHNDAATLQLSQLYETISKKGSLFSWYVRIRILTVKYLNFSPGSSRLYRLLQRALTAAKWHRE